ncbi:uncharacterized protein [Lepisosteus oculatus]|uniref:uncharacterized protein n=1 Tax=Lepisosteus oculatus TaxID=7918 RepID=UPI0037202AFA
MKITINKLDPPTHTLVRLAELVLTLNAFSLNNLFYQQVSGVAMGTRMGPSYTNIFVGWVEERFFASYTGYVPDLYKRYIDDCVGAATCSNDQLEFFLHHFTNFHPSLKYTVNISSTTLPFLDIHLSINYPRLSTSVYYKPTDSHSYLLYSSFHPNHTKNSLPFSQFLRLRRLCSDDIDFENQALEMYSFFINRGYPSSVIDRALARAKNTPRTINPIRNSRLNNRIPLVLPYHPNTLPIPRTINQNFSILQDDPSIGALFSDHPIISYRRPPNLRNLLVHSSLDRPQQPSTPGTFPCKRARCITCKYTATTTLIQGPSGQFQITQTASCTSSNLIYCISCSKCPAIYIGETGRRLGDRFREHVRAVKIKDLSKPIVSHFTSDGHDHSNLSISVLKDGFPNSYIRKTTETKIILQLGSHILPSLNDRLLFF